MTIADEVTASELQRHFTETMDRLEGSRRRTLRVNRRDGEDLVLTMASRAEADAEVVRSAARLLSAIVSNPALRSKHLLDLMRGAFPWVRFLPEPDLQTFVDELSEVLPAANDLENFAPVAQLFHEWRATAEVHADPALAEALRRGVTGDFGDVPAPPEGKPARRVKHARVAASRGRRGKK